MKRERGGMKGLSIPAATFLVLSTPFFVYAYVSVYELSASADASLLGIGIGWR